MTWNLFWRWGGDFHRREPVIMDTIVEYQPDVLGVTETWANAETTQPDLIAGELGSAGASLFAAFARTGLPPEPPEPEYPEQAGVIMGVGLVSRWPIQSTEIHELPHQQRGGKPPTALHCAIEHPRGLLHVIVTCLEWEPEFVDDQRAQASAVADIASDLRLDGPLPVLVVGDMNAAVDDPPIARLTDGMIDTFIRGGGDPAAKTIDSAIPHAPVEATHLIDRRIDHIFATDGRLFETLTVTNAFIAGDQPMEGQYGSDHYAVVVEFDL